MAASQPLYADDVDFSSLEESPSNGSGPAPSATVRLELSRHSAPHLAIRDAEGGYRLDCELKPNQLWRSSDKLYLLRAPNDKDGSTFVLRPRSAAAQRQLAALAEAAAAGAGQGKSGTSGQSHFDQKTDRGSADLYFHYYGMLQHQQNMLQDYMRTGTYHAAILENAPDFAGKAVLDVGAGSGILSLFAAQAGARVVYAVEASGAAAWAEALATANPQLGERVKVLRGRVEEIQLPEKVDVMVSEPMGTLLVNERMIESYIYARDAFLKPGGRMFPRLGRIHVAAFSDEPLHAELAAKSAFWAQRAFYGVDLSPLHGPATDANFAQVVVDQIPPHALVSNCASKTFDFLTCSEADLQQITMPLSLQVAAPCTVHGVASWFDVLFDGSASQRWLSTSPGLPITHWFQLRCVLAAPLAVVQPGATVRGELRLEAHARQSYDVHLTLSAPPLEPGGAPQESSGKFDLKEPYYRQLTPAGWYQTAQQLAAAPLGDGDAAAASAAGLPAALAVRPAGDA